MIRVSEPISALVLATRNRHKLMEMGRLLTPAGIAVEPLPDAATLPPENGDTFAENALPKARAAAEATGRPSLADDSGIEAEALGGRPGVHSARYAGRNASDQQNLDKLLREAPAGSGLRYVCALAFVDPRSGEERVFYGYCSGRLAETPRGERGFGYDPAFIPGDGRSLAPDDRRGGPGDLRAHVAGGDEHRTMAELSDAEKDRISHRGNAVRELLRWLGQ